MLFLVKGCTKVEARSQTHKQTLFFNPLSYRSSNHPHPSAFHFLSSLIIISLPPFISPLLPQTSRPFIPIITAVTFTTKLPFARDIQLQRFTNCDNLLSILAVPGILPLLFFLCTQFFLSWTKSTRSPQIICTHKKYYRT
jgi:hypothetical protein